MPAVYIELRFNCWTLRVLDDHLLPHLFANLLADASRNEPRARQAVSRFRQRLCTRQLGPLLAESGYTAEVRALSRFAMSCWQKHGCRYTKPPRNIRILILRLEKS